jgi:hypothetical protein
MFFKNNVFLAKALSSSSLSVLAVSAHKDVSSCKLLEITMKSLWNTQLDTGWR